MHFNPCGKAVDMARRPYTTACRFFSDSEQEVKVVWYPAKEPIEVLPFPSRINSLDWCSHPWLASGVGEVNDRPRTYNGKKAIDYAHGLTPCEPPEVFRTGEPRDPDKPPQLYDERGFPLCCLNRYTATGGILWGGTALLPDPPPGSSCLSSTTLGVPSVTTWNLTAGVDAWWNMLNLPGPSHVTVAVQVLSGDAAIPWTLYIGPGSTTVPGLCGFLVFAGSGVGTGSTTFSLVASFASFALMANGPASNTVLKITTSIGP